MSLVQRWRALKFAVEDKKKEIALLPPIVAVLQTIARIRASLQPVFDAITLVQQRSEALAEDYNQFLAEETKDKWTWSKINKKELVLLASFPPYALGKQHSLLVFMILTRIHISSC